MDRHADNSYICILRIFVYLHVSTGTSKVDKLLRMPSESISEGVIFQNCQGEHAPRPFYSVA